MPTRTFASCGHLPPPLPIHPPPPPSTTSSIPGYCRACDFTRTRRTVLRITEHYEEEIADLEARIETAKLELWRTWNDLLGERKEMAVRKVESLKGAIESECEGVWGEFDVRWGGMVVVGG